MRTRTAIYLLSALVVLAGCGFGAKSQGGTDPQAQTSPTAGQTTADTPIVTQSAAPPSSAAPSPTLAQPQTKAELLAFIQAGSPANISSYGGTPIASFSTPSGNLMCGLFGSPSAAAMCFAQADSWPALTSPGCNDFGDWTPNEVVAATSGVRRGACFSEQPFPMPGNVLPYGKTLSNGLVACRSESAFLACAHLSTGNGFVISRAIYHTYGTVLPAQGN
jgi:hypothetical protein